MILRIPHVRKPLYVIFQHIMVPAIFAFLMVKQWNQHLDGQTDLLMGNFFSSKTHAHQFSSWWSDLPIPPFWDSAGRVLVIGAGVSGLTAARQVRSRPFQRFSPFQPMGSGSPGEGSATRCRSRSNLAPMNCQFRQVSSQSLVGLQILNSIPCRSFQTNRFTSFYH